VSLTAAWRAGDVRRWTFYTTVGARALVAARSGFLKVALDISARID
jgi:hypothetical protein